MVKTYAPACVRNPVSMHHLVKVCPEQAIVVFLSRSQFRNPTLEISSPYLVLENQWEDSEKCVFRIAQCQDVAAWAEYSSTYLGEIWIDHHEGLSRLLVLQDCTNPEKTNFITAINPDCYDLRVYPENVLEFILCDMDVEEWVWQWDNSIECADVDLLANEVKWLYADQRFSEAADYRFAKLPRFKVEGDRYGLQHHFWFKFNNKIQPLLASETGIIQVGNFHFFGYSGSSSATSTYHASIHVSVSKRSATAFQQAKLQTLPPSSFPISRPFSQQFHVKKRALPVINEVAITRLKTDTLDEGCKTLSAEPPKRTERVLTYDTVNIQ